jgi:hypothetical protein
MWRRIILAGAAAILSGCSLVEGKVEEDHARKAVLEILADPESARFRNLRPSTVTTLQGPRVRSICGEVNAKNPMGGYVGFQSFVYVVERRLSPAQAEKVRRGSTPRWAEGEVVLVDPQWTGDVVDANRICNDGAILVEDDVNMTTPTFR